MAHNLSVSEADAEKSLNSRLLGLYIQLYTWLACRVSENKIRSCKMVPKGNA